MCVCACVCVCGAISFRDRIFVIVGLGWRGGRRKREEMSGGGVKNQKLSSPHQPTEHLLPRCIAADGYRYALSLQPWKLYLWN